MSHSIPRAADLATLVAARYGLPSVSVRLLRPGVSDVFEVRSGARRYILRAYRAGWRGDEDIGWECDLLWHLAASGVRVSTPVADLDGAPLVPVQAPEGRRQLLLLTYAEGQLTRPGQSKGAKPSVTGLAEDYGRAAAAIHASADSFTSPHRRFALHAEHLLWRPLRTIVPYLADRPRDRTWLERTVDALADQVARTRYEMDWGPCHGDLTGENAALSDGGLTVFDFDCGGPGWRAYDIGVFAWSMANQGHGKGPVDRFLAGYRAVRELEKVDRQMIAVFRAVREVWFTGLLIENADDWGHGQVDDDALDGRLELLRGFMKDPALTAGTPGRQGRD